jgi:hypothetical protein
LQLPAGATGAQPGTPAVGMMRYNTSGFIEYYNGAWTSLSSGSGTVTTVSVVSANGFAGTVATATTTPAITLSTSITGVIVGNGTALSAANSATSFPGYSASLAGGTAGTIHYQTAANTSTTLAAGTSSQVLVSGSAPSWTNTPTLTGTNFTGIPNTGLTNSSITVGTTSIALGTTSTTLAGLTGITLSSGTVTGVANPVNPTDVVNLQFYQAGQAGLEWKVEAAAASTVSLTVTYSNGAAGVGATLTNAGTQAAFSIDGYSASINDRILIKNQATQTQNGIYYVSTIGTGATNWVLTRVTDANTPATLNNATLYITNGTQAATGWTQSTANPTIGTNNIIFVQFSGSGTYVAGTGLTLTGNSFAITAPVIPALGGTGTITAPSAVGQLLIATSGNVYTPATLTQGTGITVGNASGAVTITNAGVTSLTGTSNQITASASTGAVTLSLPAAVTLSTSLTVSGLTANSFLYSGTAGLLTTTSAPTNGQLLIGSTGAAPVSAVLTPGTAIGITNAAGSITINNTGVTSNIAGTGISVSGATGAVTITNAGVTSLTGTSNQITVSASTGGVTLSTPSTFTAPGSIASTTSITAGNGLTVTAGNTTITAGTLLMNGGLIYQLTSASVTAAGTTQGTGTTLTAQLNNITTVASGTGVVLPAPVQAGVSISIVNKGANPLLVYPNSGASIDALSANTPFSIPVGGIWSGFNSSTTQWNTRDPILAAGTGISVLSTGNTLTVNNTGVTSVGLSLPAFITVSNSPVTTTGTLTGTLATQANNTVFAGPSTGGPLAPTFRTLTLADLQANAIKLYTENSLTPTAPSATGTNSIAEGSGSSATGTNTYANGAGTNASVWGSKSFANGNFATAGDAQFSVLVARCLTTTATPTIMYLDGTAATQRMVLPNNSLWTFSAIVSARRTDATGFGAGFKLEGVIKKDTTAGSTTLVGTPSLSILGRTTSTWTVAATADTTNGALTLTVTGVASQNLSWVATVTLTQVTN